MNNLETVFDVLTGFDGTAGVSGWREMSREELLTEVSDLADSVRWPVSLEEAVAIVSAAMSMCRFEETDDVNQFRESLTHFEAKNLVAKWAMKTIRVPSDLPSHVIRRMVNYGLIISCENSDGSMVYEATEYASDLINGYLS